VRTAAAPPTMRQTDAMKAKHKGTRSTTTGTR
jgi:hypothetical protein